MPSSAQTGHEKRNSSLSRHGIALAVLLASTLALGQERAFDLPSQPLATGIERFIEQAGIDLLYDSNAIRDIIGNEVGGSLTPAAALRQLLKGTGLHPVPVGPGAFALQRRVAPGAAGPDFLLPALVVTATRGAMEARSAPAAVDVIDAATLRRGSRSTLDEAIRGTVGVFGRRSRSWMDTNATLTFRGFPGQRRTLVMVDGLPLNDVYTSDVNFSAIDVLDVEQVEIVRGPFSSLYGGSAMSGVVNVITRPITESGAAASFGHGGAWHRGTAPARVRDLSFEARLKPAPAWGLSASLRRRTTDGYPSWYITRPWQPSGGPDIPAGIEGSIDTLTTGGAPTSLIGHAGRNGFRDDTVSLRLEHAPSEAHRLILHHSRNASQYDYGPAQTWLRDTAGEPVFAWEAPLTAAGTEASPLAERDFLAGGPGGTTQRLWRAGWEHDFGRASGRLQAGRVEAGRNWFITPGLRVRPGRETEYLEAGRAGGRGLLSEAEAWHKHLDYQVRLPIGQDHLLTLGGSWLDGRAWNEETALRNWRDAASRGERRSAARGRITTRAVFLQDRWQASERLSLYAGLRHDWWQARAGQAFSHATVAGEDGAFHDLDLSHPSRTIGRLSPPSVGHVPVPPADPAADGVRPCLPRTEPLRAVSELVLPCQRHRVSQQPSPPARNLALMGDGGPARVAQQPPWLGDLVLERDEGLHLSADRSRGLHGLGLPERGPGPKPRPGAGPWGHPGKPRHLAREPHLDRCADPRVPPCPRSVAD